MDGGDLFSNRPGYRQRSGVGVIHADNSSTICGFGSLIKIAEARSKASPVHEPLDQYAINPAIELRQATTEQNKVDLLGVATHQKKPAVSRKTKVGKVGCTSPTPSTT